jgi:hypothetical protein
MHSTLVSVPAQVAAGVAVGEAVGKFLEAIGVSEGTQRIGRAVGHGLASGFTGLAINALLVDPVAGPTFTPGIAFTGAFAHYQSHLARGWSPFAAHQRA